MQPKLKIPAKAAFVFVFICRFHTRAMGNRPRIKSQIVAKTL